MKISVNDQELFTLSEIQKKVICNDICSLELDADLSRRLQYIVMHKYEQCFDRLKKEWEPKLIADGATSLPTDKDALASLIFAHPEYKCRTDRDAEAKSLGQAL